MKNKMDGIRLNQDLIKEQGLTEEDEITLKISHILKWEIFKLAGKSSDMGNRKSLRMLANVLEVLEFEQQDLWKFPRDRNFHRWFDIPGCTCPKMDNSDRIGTEYRIMMRDCPIHGEPKEK